MARYERLSQTIEDESGGKETKRPPRERLREKIRKNFYRGYLIITHLIILSLVVRAGREREHLRLHMLPSEFPLAKDAIQYQDITFDPSGFWEDASRATPYEGPPTPEVDAAWKHLVRVGMYSLTRDEYEQLGLETSLVPGKEDEYLITLEVFHQLHCLNHLRQLSYGIVPYNDTEHGKAVHLAHCVDYLRQVLMCHGDLTPITLTYNETKDFLDPNFRIKHTCRNFESIWNFAAKANRSGISIEG